MSTAVTGARNTQRRIVTPGGGVLSPFAPGVSGNPGGRSNGLKPVRALCREKSMAAAQSLIRIVEDVDEYGRNREDGRIVVVAAQTILQWAYGKPPDYDPAKEDRPSMSIDTSSLTAEERRAMLAILRKGIVRETEHEPMPPAPVTIEPEHE